MNQNISELCKDPLFQLNLAIWLAQPQPKEFYVYPLFFESGLSIYSLSPLLALPVDIRLSVSKKLDCQEAVRPDLILKGKNPKKFCILECKVSSFSQSSSTARQARTLLLIAGPLILEVLAVGKRGASDSLLCYFSNSNQITGLEETLNVLTKEIVTANLEPGIYGCFGIKPNQSEILLEYSDKIKKFLYLLKDAPVKILDVEKDTDPRPLYFIPYDPNLQQKTEEQQLCRRILFERILSYIVSTIGGATIPSSVIIKMEELLSSATFGLYEVWDDSESKKYVRRLVKDFLSNIKSSINEPLKEFITYEAQKGWIFNLKDKETFEEMQKQIMKFKPETLDLSKKIEPTLFDY